jgi:hypothetical protein
LSAAADECKIKKNSKEKKINNQDKIKNKRTNKIKNNQEDNRTRSKKQDQQDKIEYGTHLHRPGIAACPARTTWGHQQPSPQFAGRNSASGLMRNCASSFTASPAATRARFGPYWPLPCQR